MFDPVRPSPRLTPRSAWESARGWLRRWQAIRWFGAVLLALLLTATVDRANRNAREAAAGWGVTEPVWVTTRSVSAGDVLGVDDVEQVGVPAHAIPGDHVLTDPTGTLARVDLGSREILRTPRLDPSGRSALAALVPDHHGALPIRVDADLFTVGDPVALHALADGRAVSDTALVVSVDTGWVGVAVDELDLPAAIAELARGGLVVVLSG